MSARLPRLASIWGVARLTRSRDCCCERSEIEDKVAWRDRRRNLMPLPLSPAKDLIIEELPGGELLVYDLTTHRAHNLNRSASLVWRHCDGETSFLAAAESLQRDLGLPADEAIVRMA